MTKLLINLVNLYQLLFSFDGGLLSFLAPGGACKYQISCSEYTKQAISQHGVWRGLSMGVRRILSCR